MEKWEMDKNKTTHEPYSKNIYTAISIPAKNEDYLSINFPMNLLSLHASPLSQPVSSIERDYTEWLSYYEDFIKLSKKTRKTITDRQNIEANQAVAIRHLKNSLASVGTCREQLIKIDVLILLIQLASTGEEKKDYFYQAVEIAERYFWPHFLDTAPGSQLLDIFVTDISKGVLRSTDETVGPAVLTIAPFVISRELERRKRERMVRALELSSDTSRDRKAEKTLSELELLLGPVRILILQKDGVPLLAHRLDDRAIQELHKLWNHSWLLDIDIYGRRLTYSYTIDLGSTEAANQINSEILDRVISQLLKQYIQKSERDHISAIDDYMAFPEHNEKAIQLRQNRDYREFYQAAFRSFPDVGTLSSEEIEERVDICARAIDICQWIPLGSTYRQESGIANLETVILNPEILFPYIDQVLSGRIQIGVLEMVTSLLRTRHETMSGMGYPVGLSKEQIPIESRIYSVIRAHEVIQRQQTATVTLVDWAKLRLLDLNMAKLFEASQGKGEYPISQEYSLPGEVAHTAASYRYPLYEPYVKLWGRLINTTREIEDAYDAIRHSEWDVDLGNRMYLKINMLQNEVLELADMCNVFFITRHGEVRSDTVVGVPGTKDEMLTQDWVLSSIWKWKAFRSLRLTISSSPSSRTVQTSTLICQQVQNCTEACLSCSKVSLRDELRNPPKNNRWYPSVLFILGAVFGGRTPEKNGISSYHYFIMRRYALDGHSPRTS